MKPTYRPRLAAIALLSFLVTATPSVAAEKEAGWPQFRGPDRNGVSAEQGLLAAWPEAGPKELWRVPLGAGYSAVVAQGNRLFTQFAAGEEEVIASFNPSDGSEVWRVSLGKTLETEMGNGPRSTPTVAGDTIFAVGSAAVLMALRTKDGKVQWQVDLQKRFPGRLPNWGLSTSPLVDGDLVIFEVGSEEASIAAFDRKTGETRWTTTEKSAGYNSPLAATLDGVRQYIFAPSSAPKVISLLPDGTLYWTHEWHGGTIAMPVQVGDDGIFVSASSDVGGMLLRVRSEGGQAKVEEVWRNREMKNHFSSSVAYDGHIYGFDNGSLKCIDATSGERKWTKRGLGKGTLIVAEGKLFLLSERGQLVMARATPEAYDELGRKQVLSGKTWTSPSLADGRLYLRDLEDLVCLDVRAQGS
ncbi:MAG: PQQ-binding-like beta-propeller repeat protein [Deltaproteobacteria bacterium]|nr:PQQ-binding-like beta-propeller repeat protein [Deltaproteobacteria bacterium]